MDPGPPCGRDDMCDIALEYDDCESELGNIARDLQWGGFQLFQRHVRKVGHFAVVWGEDEGLACSWRRPVSAHGLQCPGVEN